jgi:type II secretory pathway component GspD/PulD (secretin)
MKQFCTMVALVLLLFAVPVRAQGQPDQPTTKTLVYDIRGLLQSGGDRSEVTTSYIKLIEDTIHPETWKDNGGETGMIRELNGMLIVTHTEDTHRQVAELLNQLNEKQSRLVRVRVHWLVGTAEQLNLTDKSNGATRQIDPNALNNLPKEIVHHQAQTVCFSGQAVSLHSGTRHSYVSQLSPVVGTQSVGYDPKLESALDGTELKIRPTLQTDGKSAYVEMTSTVSRWSPSQPLDMRQVASSTTRPAPLGGETVIDRPNTSEQTLSTALRVPVGAAVIVGGMTVEPGLDAPNGPQMLVVVEVFAD